MNEIKRSPIGSLGYQFISGDYLPAHKDEYYLRNRQNNHGIAYRQLNAYEIEVLVRNRNMSDDWNRILVGDAFNPELVQDCKFHGLVRIGKLEPWYLEFHNLRRPVGLYNSTIISCDFGDNVVVDNVNYISHYIVGSEAIIVNVNEIAATSAAKFGNGIIKEGESEAIRIWLEVCNENGGRKIMPFDGMQPGDAWLWTQDRDNADLQEKYAEFTGRRFDRRRGYYGSIGDRTVIKNTKIIKDVNIGSDAYIKGANKIKNVTINSSPEAITQIGEGCELVNGIVDYGCRIFYGVKAVRFFLSSHSQLKYGARLINSYLGNNSTISCCEVLNSLIFPAHEQHHNNSFLCAALVQGQSNIAAGATIGSNHNSRSPDGELFAGRGFWPGLCVSLKHNSRFATYTILAKGDYPAELNIQLPFSLVSNDVHNNELIVMPAYWFLYNMYALARNSWKYRDRDRRIEPMQHIEFNYLAPDSVNEIINALGILEEAVARAYQLAEGKPGKKSVDELRDIGRDLLENQSAALEDLPVYVQGFENSSRKARILKPVQAYRIFRELVAYYTACALLENAPKSATGATLLKSLPSTYKLQPWLNVGGQLIPLNQVEKLKEGIRTGKIKGWEAIHAFYARQSVSYSRDKLEHALAAYKTVYGAAINARQTKRLKKVLQDAVRTRIWMVENIHASRAKDYTNPYRKMLYADLNEMNAVVGKLKDNSFIRQEKNDLLQFQAQVNRLTRSLSRMTKAR